MDTSRPLRPFSLARLVAAPFVGALAAFAASDASADAVLVSARPDGASGGDESSLPSISANGRSVAFVSSAPDLVEDDGNFADDVFVRSLSRRTTELVAVTADGVRADAGSDAPFLSATGRWVVFECRAGNLPDGTGNGLPHVYRKDLKTGELVRVSRSVSGGDADAPCSRPSISKNGRYVVFWSSATNLVEGDVAGWFDCFLTDMKTGVTTRISTGFDGSEADGHSLLPRISANGRFVAFESDAPDLVADDPNPDETDVFVADLKKGGMSLVSRRPGGQPTTRPSRVPDISANGRVVSFLSADGGLVPEDDNGFFDIFAADLRDGTIVRVSVGPEGEQAGDESTGHAISPDGRYVAFSTLAANFADDGNDSDDLFLADRKQGTSRLLSAAPSGATGNSATFEPSVSLRGRAVAATTSASDLLEGAGSPDADVIVFRN